jgi:cyclopropane fatty-acyl-phospholipid synthase-like methyltransferase
LGDEPGQLARITLNYLQNYSFCSGDHLLVDLGCGYGRDSLYIAQHCKVRIYAVDSSATAIESARSAAVRINLDPGMFYCRDLFSREGFPEASVIYSSNVYQILKPDERARFRDLVRENLEPRGVFFLATLSVNDPEHRGKGRTVEGETGSIIETQTGKYLHLCKKEEILHEFSFLNITDLYEIEYIEPRTGGDHHHISWIMIGHSQDQEPGKSPNE